MQHVAPGLKQLPKIEKVRLKNHDHVVPLVWLSSSLDQVELKLSRPMVSIINIIGPDMFG